MDTLALVDVLERNNAALEWHGGVMYFSVGAALGLLFIGLVGLSMLRSVR